MTNLIDPKTDFAFRKLFANNTERSKRMLLSLINAYLAKEPKITVIKEINVINPYNTGEFEPDKESILDIKAIDENGHWYNIEMQASADPEYFKRALFYWAKVYTNQLSKGEKYSKLKKTIGIHFLDFYSIESYRPDYHHTFNLANFKNPKLVPFGIDLLEIHLIELPKFKREYSPFNVVEEEWTQFFADIKKLSKETNQIKTPEVKEALSDLDKLNLKGIDRECYEASLRRMAEKNTLIEQAENRGIKAGEKKGREEGEKKLKEEKLAIAKTLKSQGLTPSQIAAATGITKGEIEKL